MPDLKSVCQCLPAFAKSNFEDGVDCLLKETRESLEVVQKHGEPTPSFVEKMEERIRGLEFLREEVVAIPVCRLGGRSLL